MTEGEYQSYYDDNPLEELIDEHILKSSNRRCDRCSKTSSIFYPLFQWYLCEECYSLARAICLSLLKTFIVKRGNTPKFTST